MLDVLPFSIAAMAEPGADWDGTLSGGTGFRPIHPASFRLAFLGVL
jgi:hypothetical protein